MFARGVMDDLMMMGLTTEESRLYLYLVATGSGTVKELSASGHFSQRSNIYRVLESLRSKGFVLGEEKEGAMMFFPSSPDGAILDFITKQRQLLEDLETRAEEIATAIESEARTRFTGNVSHVIQDLASALEAFPREIRETILLVAPGTWKLKEKPYARKQRGAGTIYSVEFNTGRRFGPAEAGIIVHDFPYTEHRDEALETIAGYHRAEMEKGLEIVKNQGPVRLKSYRFMPSCYKDVSVTRIETKMSFTGIFNGGMATFILREHDTRIYCAWGADERDFHVVMDNFIATHSLPESLRR